jgi:hypothetical protein
MDDDRFPKNRGMLCTSEPIKPCDVCIREKIAGSDAMRVFLGMILGVLLTISVAYINDHITSGPSIASTQVRTTDGSGRPVTTTTDTTTRKPWVNWDVVDSDWRGFTTRARHAWNQLSAKLKS